MIHKFSSAILQGYNFSFPRKLIATKPASPRDKARLMIFNRESKAIFNSYFINLPDFLPPRSVIVFNETKVIPAKLMLQKETGGRFNMLYLKTLGPNIEVLANRKLKLNSRVFLDSRNFFTVISQDKNHYFLTPSFRIKNLSKILRKYGQTPIPPYIKNSPLAEIDLKNKYQTIFAKKEGSVAAPTASLHFTRRLFKKLKQSGVLIEFITLHVGLGTFAPLTKKNLEEEKLHEEYFEISPKTARFLNRAKKEGRPIIAVGTTVLRTLETAANNKGELEKLSGTTDLFIRSGYKFKFVDGLITNFHVPKSSLIMLVAAFVGREKILELYKKAINKNFRLFSFGDGMLIY